jgi:hypothetical protein
MAIGNANHVHHLHAHYNYEVEVGGFSELLQKVEWEKSNFAVLRCNHCVVGYASMD